MKKDDSDFKTVLLRRICDFIAGMYDRYAMDCFERFYGEKGYDEVVIIRLKLEQTA